MTITDREQTVEAKAIADALEELTDYTEIHRLSYKEHDHDCYEEWSILRDQARALLAQYRGDDPLDVFRPEGA